MPRPGDTDSGPSAPRWAPAVCLTLISVVYLVFACLRAAREKLWFDEILTFDAASLLPSMGTLWSFLKSGLEFNPPLSFLLSAGSERIFGANELGLRFPSIVEFWVMGLCLYVFLRRRLPWQFATAGALLPFLTAGRYAHEARPYALVLALAGIALVAWQSAGEGRRRGWALVALGLALGAALCSQPLAVVLAVPFVAGEVARSMERRRIDWPVWCAFAAATPSLLVLWALKSAGNKTAYSRFTGSLPAHLGATYVEMLRPLVVPLALALVVALVLRSGTVGRGLRRYEVAALAGFALIPFAAVPVSILGGHYWMRYSLGCTIGLAGLAAALLFRIAGTSRAAGGAVLLVLGACFARAQFGPENMRTDGAAVVNTSEEIQALVEQIPGDAPVVIGPPMTFVELEHYSKPGMAARLYYLTDAAAGAAIDGDSGFEVKGPLLGRYFPFRANFADYRTFIAGHKRFYIVRPIRNLARECLVGRLNCAARVTAGGFGYYEATVR